MKLGAWSTVIVDDSEARELGSSLSGINRASAEELGTLEFWMLGTM
jgi:hypothetical protein